MSQDSWKRRTLPSLKPAPSVSSSTYSTYDPLIDQPDPYESKTPRVLTRALRSLSNSSIDSTNTSSPRRSGSMRRLQKTQSGSSSMIERFHRRVSRDIPSTMSLPDMDSPAAPLDQPFSSMDLLHWGHLKTDASLLKPRSEYLVLTDQCLVKFGSAEAARSVFPQLSQPEGQHRRTASQVSSSAKSAVGEIRFEIPLRSVVAVFNEEGASPRFGIEIWWFSQLPRLAYCRAHLFFSLPKERDDWLASIHRACRAKLRRAPVSSAVPENLRIRIDHIVANNESQFSNETPQSLIFPVAKRVAGTSHKPNVAEEAQHTADGSNFYFVVGPCMCYLVEVLRAEYGTPAGDLRVKYSHFGTVTLTRFRASVASCEQRFVMSFRSPFGRETRLDLASIHYRRIIEAMTRVDRILKPMWPQHFQQIVFDIKGLPPPLQLTSGNDLGGVERSLEAYCAAFHVDMPRWTVDWHASSQPAFRLLPLEDAQYSPLQLMAVFRALRYNSFFKAISFRDVDLSPLAGRKDYSPFGEGVVCASLNGCEISEDHCDDLLQSPVLTQEFHALAFASESIRSIDLANSLGVMNKRSSQTRMSADISHLRRTSSEILRPILMLARAGLCMCHSINMSGNPLSPADIDDLANILVLDHVSFRKLELSGCSLGDAGLSKLWAGIPGQAHSLQTIDTSDNHGIVKCDVLRHGLDQLRAIRKLNISGNTRLDSGNPLVDEATMNGWTLTELDLSGIALNDATVDVLASYLQTAKSQHLRLIRLNKCGLTSRQIARLFRAMGQSRRMTVHINANRLDEGIDDLCGALACGYGPWSLFIQMVEFGHESSYIKLWKALTVNKTIECLSLAGSSTPDEASSTACQAVADFFVNNDTVRFLDISGYDAKLDEGRLGKEFSKALRGMRSNSKIEHLRVRSQMLNINVGDLAEAISGNKKLHTLDCEDNDFNLSNYRHLIKHLSDNSTIRHFSIFSPEELERSVRRSVTTLGSATPSRRASLVSRFRYHDKLLNGNEKALAQQLQHEWDAAAADLELILERNRRLHEETKTPDDDIGSQSTGSDSAPRENEGTFSESFGGLAYREYESRRKSPSTPGTPRRNPSVAGSSTSATDLQSLTGRLRLDGKLMRSDSVISSEASTSPTSACASGSVSPAVHTPNEGLSPKERTVPPIPEVSVDYPNDDGYYTCTEDPHSESGLQIKTTRRQFYDAVSRIEEEDDTVCAA